MGRKAHDYVLQKRESGIYRYRLKGWPRGKWRTTHTSNVKRANQIASRAAMKNPLSNPEAAATLGKYAEPFYDPRRCPHVARLREEGKSITDRHCRIQRGRMKKHLLTDQIRTMKITKIRRADILDFRSRLVHKLGQTGTVEKVMGILKTILKEAYYREDIPHDPTTGVGKVKAEKKRRGTFTRKEVRAIFAENPGIFATQSLYTAFLLAAHVGMRRGEIIALRWEQIDLDNRMIHIDRAWTGTADETGDVKWHKSRTSPLTAKCVDALRKLKKDSIWVMPDRWIFCDPITGRARGETWWSKGFRRAMVAGGFITKRIEEIDGKKKTVYDNPRNLVPHGFRHTLNTRMRDAGYDAGKIRESMGWEDESTQEEYTDWRTMDFNGLRDVIEREFG